MEREPERAEVTERPPRISVEAEASLMNRGTMRNFSYLVAGALLVGGVGFLLVQRLGRADAYAEAAASTARIGRDHFNGFFDCALPGTRASELNAQRVQSGLERLGARDGKNYGQALTRCLPKLRALSQEVRTLETPALVSSQRQALLDATKELGTANTHYLYYLTDGIDSYDATTAKPLQKRVGTAWASYRAAESELVAAMADRP